MNNDDPSDSVPLRLWIPALLLTLLFTACSPSVAPVKSLGMDYQQAKMTFRQGNMDRVLTLTDTLASGKASNPNTLKARVLRAVIYSSRIQAYKELADAYAKGSNAATKTQTVSAYNDRRSNAMQYGSEAALNLGEVIMEFTSAPAFPKELTLDAPWPSVQAPQMVDALSRVRIGAWVPEDEQDSAATDLQHKAVDDVLGELVGGGRSKAQMAMEVGPVKLSGLDFAFFLEKQMVDGLALFGPKYLAIPGQLKTLCGVADRFVPTIEAMLKEKPDKAKETELREIQKQIKDAEKFT